MKEMPIPQAARRDPEAVEMLRVWIAENSLWCSVKVGIYAERQIPEETAWGVILADATRHIANALSADSGIAPETVIDLIRQSLLAELGDPTSGTSGSFVRAN
jgi:hypothetical protein